MNSIHSFIELTVYRMRMKCFKLLPEYYLFSKYYFKIHDILMKKFKPSNVFISKYTLKEKITQSIEKLEKENGKLG